MHSSTSILWICLTMQHGTHPSWKIKISAIDRHLFKSNFVHLGIKNETYLDDQKSFQNHTNAVNKV